MAGLIRCLLLSETAGSVRARTGKALQDTRGIYREQPRPIEPLTFEPEQFRATSRQSRRTSQWLAEGRSLASRASSKTSLATRRNGSRRPTIGSIGAPYDFKKIDPPRRRSPGFRPLTLSIHIPGNELASLPEFEEAIMDETGLTFPPPALTKSRSDPLLSGRPSTAFSIPRKPVPSRTVSMDLIRSSIDSRYTFNDDPRPSQSIHRQPSFAPSQSTQDLLDALDDRVPQSPPPSRSKCGPEPVHTLYRRASEQSLRLRTHLEERQQMERRFPECHTIMEDKEGDLEKSPVLTRLTGPALLGETESPRGEAQREEEVILQRPRAPSTRTRISQWLLRTNPATMELNNDEEPLQPPSYSLRPSSTHDRTSVSSSLYSTCSNAADHTTTSWTSPRSSPHGKGSSLSSCQTMGFSARRQSLDVEKRSVPVVSVGVAY